MRHRTSSEARYIVSIGITWFLGLLSAELNVIPVFTTKVKSQYFVINSQTILFISLLVMFDSYSKIRMRLKSTSNQFTPSQINRMNSDRNLCLLKTIFLVIAVSFVFWFPTLPFMLQEFFVWNVFLRWFCGLPSVSCELSGESVRVYMGTTWNDQYMSGIGCATMAINSAEQ